MRLFTRLRTVAFAFGCAASLAACASRPPPVSVPSATLPAGPTPTERLADARALLRTGCLDCLLEAYGTFSALRLVPAVGAPATIGAIQSAGLIALRERSLGMTDSGHLQAARELVSGQADAPSVLGVALDAIEATSLRIGRLIGERDVLEAERRVRSVQQNRTRWAAVLGAAADDDPFSAVVWASFTCANSPTAAGRTGSALLEPLATQRDAPVVAWEISTCGVLDAEALQNLVALEPRYREADYWLAFNDMRGMKLDEAQARLAAAYEWHAAWPSVALALAGLAMTNEDFPPALDLYDRTLALLPGLGEAMVGRVRALSYMERYDDAIAGANQFLEALPGDAHFWRAWNENQLAQIEAAWVDIEEARRTLTNNSEVAKLGGIVAYRRHELDVARSRFETARRLNPDDCDAHFYLGGVQAELKAWAASADAYLTACHCLEAAVVSFSDQIVRLQASDAPADRRARLIASRQAKIAAAERALRQSWFNLGADYFNLQRFSEARVYAEKVADDEQFGERAREILSGLTP